MANSLKDKTFTEMISSSCLPTCAGGGLVSDFSENGVLPAWPIEGETAAGNGNCSLVLHILLTYIY